MRFAALVYALLHDEVLDRLDLALDFDALEGSRRGLAFRSARLVLQGQLLVVLLRR